jgi:acetylornithine deacetylase
VEGDRLYGRGSNDMKAGISSIVFAVRAFLESGFRPIGSIILQSVVEEEFGGGGTIAALQRGYTASAALIAEPSGVTNISLGSAGSRFIRVEVEGRSDAPQSFHKGVNAIDPGYRVYRAISQLNRERQRRLRGKNPAYEKKGKGVMFGDGKVTNLVVGRFRAGDFPATVAGYAQLEGRIGFPAPEMGDDVIAEYESVIRREAKKDEWLRRHPPRVSWFNAQRDPYVLDAKESIVRETADAVRSVVGDTAPLLFATPSASDAVFLAKRAGRVGGIPTIVYGPGGANAHAADEFVSLKETRQVTKVIAVLIKRWCGVGAADDDR